MRRRIIYRCAPLLIAICTAIAIDGGCRFSAEIIPFSTNLELVEVATVNKCNNAYNIAFIIAKYNRESVNVKYELITQTDPLLKGLGTGALNVEVKDVAPAGVSMTLGNLGYVTIGTPTGRAIALAMDNSGSLAGLDDDGNRATWPMTDPQDKRIAAAKEFVGDALGSQDRISLYAFHGASTNQTRVRQVVGFTANRSLLQSSLENLTTQEKDGTPLYDAIVDASTALRTQSQASSRSLVLFVDGKDSTSTNTLGSAANAIANDPKIPTFSITLDSAVEEANKPDLSFHQNLACSTAHADAAQNKKGLLISVEPPHEDPDGLDRAFKIMSFLTIGYYDQAVSINGLSGLGSGTHTITAKLYVRLSDDTYPKECTADGRCPRYMQCDNIAEPANQVSGRCYAPIKFKVKNP